MQKSLDEMSCSLETVSKEKQELTLECENLRTAVRPSNNLLAQSLVTILPLLRHSEDFTECKSPDLLLQMQTLLQRSSCCIEAADVRHACNLEAQVRKLQACHSLEGSTMMNTLSIPFCRNSSFSLMSVVWFLAESC
jgi:hypothetical protein